MEIVNIQLNALFLGFSKFYLARVRTSTTGRKCGLALGPSPISALVKKKIARGWWFQPLWKIVACWDHYSQYMEKHGQNPSHQPDMVHHYLKKTIKTYIIYYILYIILYIIYYILYILYIIYYILDGWCMLKLETQNCIYILHLFVNLFGILWLKLDLKRSQSWLVTLLRSLEWQLNCSSIPPLAP